MDSEFKKIYETNHPEGESFKLVPHGKFDGQSFIINGEIETVRAAADDMAKKLNAPVSIYTMGGDLLPDYCTQNGGVCPTCSLANSGRDCMNNQITAVEPAGDSD